MRPSPRVGDGCAGRARLPGHATKRHEKHSPFQKRSTQRPRSVFTSGRGASAFARALRRAGRRRSAPRSQALKACATTG